MYIDIHKYTCKYLHIGYVSGRIHIHIHVYAYIDTYIYIERERESERELRPSLGPVDRYHFAEVRFQSSCSGTVKSIDVRREPVASR